MCCQKNHVEYEGTATAEQTHSNKFCCLLYDWSLVPKLGAIVALKTRIWHRLFSILGKQANIQKIRWEMILSEGHRVYIVSAILTEPPLSLYFGHTFQSSVIHITQVLNIKSHSHSNADIWNGKHLKILCTYSNWEVQILLILWCQTLFSANVFTSS